MSDDYDDGDRTNRVPRRSFGPALGLLILAASAAGVSIGISAIVTMIRALP